MERAWGAGAMIRDTERISYQKAKSGEYMNWSELCVFNCASVFSCYE